jgi:hypothetical protein
MHPHRFGIGKLGNGDMAHHLRGEGRRQCTYSTFDEAAQKVLEKGNSTHLFDVAWFPFLSSLCTPVLSFYKGLGGITETEWGFEVRAVSKSEASPSFETSWVPGS